MNKFNPSLLPLSEANLWKQQEDYYKHEGIDAWKQKIPYYATNNLHIANSYAHIILNFTAEINNTSPTDSSNTVYIVELGAGAGVFAFYLLKALLERTETLPTSTNHVYVMTDMVEENILFWEQEPLFKEFFDHGLLDTASFNMETGDDILLRRSGISLTQNTGSPVIFIANYVFDTLPQDVFKINTSHLESFVIPPDTKLDIESANPYNLPIQPGINLDQLSADADYRPVKFPFYREKVFDTLLQQYHEHYANSGGYLLFPIGCLRACQKLMKISNKKMLLLSTDKAFSQHIDSFILHPPDITFHHRCFSMMVNFDAVGKYFENAGGGSFHQRICQNLMTSAFCIDRNFHQLPATRQTLAYHLDQFGPGSLVQLFVVFRNTHQNWPLSDILSFLRLTRWDPFVLNICINTVIQQIHQGCAPANSPTAHDLLNGMLRIAENIYNIPDHLNALFNIGLIFHSFQKYPEALKFYQKALDKKINTETLHFNTALCHLALNNKTDAYTHFHQAHRLNPQNMTARGWLAELHNPVQKPEKSRILYPYYLPSGSMPPPPGPR